MFSIALLVFTITQGAFFADGLSIMRKKVTDYKFEVGLALMNTSVQPPKIVKRYGLAVITAGNSLWTTNTVFKEIIDQPPNEESTKLCISYFDIKLDPEGNCDFGKIDEIYVSKENPHVYLIFVDLSYYMPFHIGDRYSSARTGYINLPSENFFGKYLGYKRKLTNLRYTLFTVFSDDVSISTQDARITASLTDGLKVIGLRINETHFAKVKKEMHFDDRNLWNPRNMPPQPGDNNEL